MILYYKMKNVKYFLIPQWNSMVKVTEDCCYEKVVFMGPTIGVSAKNDELEDIINSWDLLCYDCNPDLEIRPIEKGDYDSMLNSVNKLRA